MPTLRNELLETGFAPMREDKIPFEKNNTTKTVQAFPKVALKKPVINPSVPVVTSGTTKPKNVQDLLDTTTASTASTALSTIEDGLFDTAAKPSTDYSGMSWQELEKQRLAGDGISLGADFVSADLAARQDDATETGFTFGVGEDVAGYDKQYLGTDFANQKEMSAKGQLTGLQDTGTEQRLGELGLQRTYEQDMYKGYKYNSATGEYDFYDNTPSIIDKALPVLIKSGIIAASTAGMGSALAGSSALAGYAPAVQQGIGYGIASGTSTAIQGGDLGDVATSALKGGLAAYTSGLESAVKDADYMLELGEAGAASLQSQYDIVSTIKTTTNLAELVESGDVLGAINKVLDLQNSESISTVVSGFFAENFGTSDFVMKNLKAISDSSIVLADKLLQGENLEVSVKNAAFEYWSKKGTLEGLFGEGTTFNFDTPEWVEEIGNTLLEGASAINNNVIKPVVDVVKQLGTDSYEAAVAGVNYLNDEVLAPTIKFLEEEGGELLDSLGEGVKDIGNFLIDSGTDVVEFLKTNGKDFANFLSSAGEGVVTFLKDNGEDFLGFLKESGTTFADFIGGAGESVGAFLKENGKAFLGFMKENGESFTSFLKEKGSTFADFISEGWDAISDMMSGADAEWNDFMRTKNADSSSIIKRRSVSQFQIQDLTGSTGLENELLA